MHNDILIKRIKYDSNIFSKKLILKVAIGIFVTVAFSFTGSGMVGPSWLALLVIFLFNCSPRRLFAIIKRDFPVEIKIFNFWFFYAFITGIFVATDMNYFLEGIESLLLIVLIVNLSCIIILYDISLIRIFLIFIFLSGLLQFYAVEFQVGDYINQATGRYTGFSENPNSLGMKMVYSTLALLWVSVGPKASNFISLLKWAIIIITFIAFLDVIILSASRKSLMSFGFVLILGLSFLIMNKGKKVNFIRLSFIVALIVFLAFSFTSSFINDTLIAERLEQGAQDLRYELFQEGINHGLDNPIMGIGVNNFRVLNGIGSYSNADYPEVISSTGIVGAILYYFVFISLMVKSLKYSYSLEDRMLRFYCFMITIGIMCLLLLGLGVILYISFSAMIILAIFAGFISKIEKLNI